MLDIYNLVVELIGPVPIEFEFVYAIGALALFLLILLCVMAPFILIYKLSRW